MRWLERLTSGKQAGSGQNADGAQVEGAGAEAFPRAPLRSDAPLANPLLLPPLTLAYVGDAVFELYVRNRLVALGRIRVGDLHKAAVRYVRASAQARTLTEIASTLSDDELDVVRRGRNAKSHAAPKGSDASEYAASTAFETLLGYLYLSGRDERLGRILETAAQYVEHEE